jgi:hypothetical protein
VGFGDLNVRFIVYIAYRYEMIIGIPPFYDKSSNKMFLNIESAPIRWPDAVRHGISISPEA